MALQRVILIKKKQLNKTWHFSSLKKALVLIPELQEIREHLNRTLKHEDYEDSIFIIKRFPLNPEEYEEDEITINIENDVA